MKSFLKNAKTAMDEGRHEEAIKACENALNCDSSPKEKYTAKIMLGLALYKIEKFEECEKIFTSASELQPEAPQAWKGLLDSFEKRKSYAKMAQPINHLLEIVLSKGNIARAQILRMKLAKAYILAGNPESALDVLDQLKDSQDVTFSASAFCKIKIGEIQLSKFMANVRDKAQPATLDFMALEQPFLSIIELIESNSLEAVKQVLDAEETSSKSIIEAAAGLFQQLGEIAPICLEKTESPDALVKLCWKFISSSCVEKGVNPVPAAAALLGASQYHDLSSVVDVDICEKLVETGFPNHPLLLSHCALKTTNSQAQIDKNWLQLASLQTELLLPHLARLHLLAISDQLPCSPEVGKKVLEEAEGRIQAAKECRCTCVKMLETAFQLATSSVLSASGDVSLAKQAYQGLLQQDPCHFIALKGLVKLHLKTGCLQAAEEGISRLLELNPEESWVQAHHGWLLHLQASQAGGVSSEARAVLEKAVVEQPNSFWAVFYLGKLYWDLGGAERAEKPFAFTKLLMAAKNNPRHGECFAYLGLWYQQVGNDPDRAAKCYIKALALCPGNKTAGEALGELYLCNGQETLALSMWQTATDQAPTTAIWAWHRMGRYHIFKGAFMEATDCFLQGLRNNPLNGNLWADLGHTYYRQGKHVAALKAYTKAEEFTSPSSKWAQCAMATVERELGLVDDAAARFESCLETSPNDSVALQGLAETCLSQAHARVSEGLYSHAGYCLKRGVQAIKRFLHSESYQMQTTNKKVFAHKLAGDLYTYAHHLPPSCFEGCDGGFFGFIQQGESHYDECTQLSDKDAKYYFDAGLNLLLQAKFLKLKAGDGSGCVISIEAAATTHVQLSEKARIMFQEALKRDSLHAPSWNALGIAHTDPLVQQHCFVRAIQLEHYPSAWANLGMLYFTHGRNNLAREAFGGLQAVQDNPMMWIGLGLLHESENDMSRATDAYLSALETTQHIEGLLGLAATAVTSGRTVDGLVSLQKYVQLNPWNSYAWNLLGNLWERTGQVRKAVESYQSALSLLDTQHGSQWSSLHRKVCINLGVVLVRNHEGRKAIEVYQRILDSSDEILSFNAITWKAKAYILNRDWDKAKDCLSSFEAQKLSVTETLQLQIEWCLLSFFQEDFEVLVSRLHALENVQPCGDKDRQLLCMAAVIAKFIGEESIVSNLMYLCKSQNSRKMVEIEASFMTNEEPASKKALCKALHLYPNSPRMWTQLGRCISRQSRSKDGISFARTGQKCVQVGSLLIKRGLLEGNTPSRFPQISSANSTLDSALKLTLGDASTDLKGSRRRLLKAIHLFPDRQCSWQTLAYVNIGLLASEPGEIGSERNVIELKNVLGSVVQEKRKENNFADDSDKNALQDLFGILQCKEHFPQDDQNRDYAYTNPILTARLYLKQGKYEEAIESYKQALQQDSSQDAAWRELAHLYISQKMTTSAEATMVMWKKSLDPESPSYSIVCTLLALLYYELNEYEKGMESIEDMCKYGPENAIGHFLRSFYWAQKGGKIKQAQGSFQRAVNIEPNLLHLYKSNFDFLDVPEDNQK